MDRQPQRPSRLFALLTFLLPFLGTMAAIALMRVTTSPREAESLAARLRELETRLDSQASERRAPVFVVDPAHGGSEAGVAEAVAELSRQLEELRRRQDGVAEGEVSAWVESLDADDRRRAVRRLRDRARTDPQARQMLKGLLADPDGRVRRDVIDALERTGDPSHMADVRPLLSDPDGRVRERAARALAHMAKDAKDPVAQTQVARDLNELLAVDDRRAREGAVAGLRDLGGSAAVPGLMRALADADPGVQREAIRGLRDTGDPQALAALRKTYGDGAGPNALEAALALKQAGDPSSFQQQSARLLTLAQTGTSDERRDALRLLAEHTPSEQSRPLLEKALYDPSDRVRWDARRALDRLGK